VDVEGDLVNFELAPVAVVEVEVVAVDCECEGEGDDGNSSTGKRSRKLLAKSSAILEGVEGVAVDVDMLWCCFASLQNTL
jgi:hypothetical protein